MTAEHAVEAQGDKAAGDDAQGLDRAARETPDAYVGQRGAEGRRIPSVDISRWAS